jgi:hypothetical protein
MLPSPTPSSTASLTPAITSSRTKFRQLLVPSSRAALSGVLLITALLGTGAALADTPRPIPDINTLMKEVQAHQRDLDKTRENYTFRERQTITELDKNGHTTKTEQRELEVFFVNSHQIEKLVRKNGQALGQAEQDKETDRIKKEVERAQRTPPGIMMDEKSQVSVARLLSIENFRNPRRIQMDDRSVLAFDFSGNPDARTHGASETASKKLSGTIWIDEQDRQVRRVQATLEDNFHLGFGLFSLSRGSNFSFDQKLVNGELWLPTSASIHIEAHAVAFLSYRANIQITYDQYQRFHTNSQQQTGSTVTPQ